MYVPLPFPKCVNCGRYGLQGYHRGCNGELEINPFNNNVKCIKCNDNWNVWETTFFCKCGNSFSSDDINDSIEEMLSMCRLAMDEIERIQKQRRQKDKLTADSIRSFLITFFSKIGYVAGIAVGTIIEAVLKFF